MSSFAPVPHAALLCLFALLTSVARAEFAPPHDIAFTAEADGTEQRYVLLLPPNMDCHTPRTLLVALHGHGADRWQFATNTRDECRGVRDVALEHGMVFVSPDYRAKTSWMGPLAEADVLQIIRDFRVQYPIDRVILAGGSMGGTAALTFAAIHPEQVDGVVALNATANHLEYEKFQEAIADSFGGTKREIPEEYVKRSAEYWPLRLAMPIALTTGGADTSVPPDSLIRLAAILQKLYPHVIHLHRPETGHTTSYEDTVTAMRHVATHAAATVRPDLP